MQKLKRPFKPYIPTEPRYVREGGGADMAFGSILTFCSIVLLFWWASDHATMSKKNRDRRKAAATTTAAPAAARIRDDKSLLISLHALRRMNSRGISMDTLLRGIENVLSGIEGEQKLKVFHDGRKLNVHVHEGNTRRTIKTIYFDGDPSDED